MHLQNLQFIDVGSGDRKRRIAIRLAGGEGPPLVWLGGFKSHMDSIKALAIAEWAREHNHQLIRFDYSGHGSSTGAFEDGTISEWFEDTMAVLETFVSEPMILIGSSMGAWIGLLAARQLATKPGGLTPKGLVLVAPAVDFTERLMWDAFTDDIKDMLAKNGVWYRSTDLGDSQPVTRHLIEDGRRHLMMTGTLETPSPVRIIHGMRDKDIPWQFTMELVSCLEGNEVIVTLIKGADHVLHRKEDMAIIFDAIEAFASR